jgi:hypothetical protein
MSARHRPGREGLFYEENREVELVWDGYSESIRDFEFDLKTENIDIPVARSNPVADWNGHVIKLDQSNLLFL